MKIIQPSATGIKEQAPASPVARAPGQGAPKVALGLRESPAAEVELSPTAASLRANAASAEFDAAKVERISQSIADGSYKVNAEAIADKLIANAQELLGKVRR